MHMVPIDVEHRLDQRRFAANDDEFVVSVVEGRANSTRIAHHKGISMSQQTSNAVSTIPQAGCTPEDPCDVDILGNETETSLRTVTCG